MHSVAGAEAVVIGDVSSFDQMRSVAQEVNALGKFNAVIHNVGIGYQEPERIETKDGLPHVFAVNTLAPYVLTALIQKPERLVYLSSRLHESGDPSLDDATWGKRQ
jgi:NAD(P)-dependent dehydrogenase (short-subunit alcohol dehydrogenase family)